MRNETWLRMLSGFVLVGVFAAGALFGAGLLRWTQRAPEALPAPSAPPGPPLPGGPVLAMQHELALDDAQMQQLHGIMQTHRPQLEQVMHETQSKVRDVLFSIEDDLKPYLRPDQVQRLEQWRAHRPPPPIGPPGMNGGPPPPPP